MANVLAYPIWIQLGPKESEFWDQSLFASFYAWKHVWGCASRTRGNHLFARNVSSTAAARSTKKPSDSKDQATVIANVCHGRTPRGTKGKPKQKKQGQRHRLMTTLVAPPLAKKNQWSRNNPSTEVEFQSEPTKLYALSRSQNKRRGKKRVLQIQEKTTCPYIWPSEATGSLKITWPDV